MALKRARIRVGPGGAGGDAGNTNTKLWRPQGSAGSLQYLGINYVSTGNAEQDLVLKRDSSGGSTVFTRSNSETDLALIALASPGAIDEAQGATDAADAKGGGIFFTNGLHASIAQMDNASYADLTFLWKPLKKKRVRLTTDGGGDATEQWRPNRPTVVRAIQVDYSATAGAGTTLVVKSEASNGTTVWTKDANETDFGPVSVGMPAIDEAGNAAAATDGVPEGGIPFVHGLWFVIASGGSGKITDVSLWYE